MVIQLWKETDLDGFWYCVFINNIFKFCYVKKVKITNSKNSPKIKVLKEEII